MRFLHLICQIPDAKTALRAAPARVGGGSGKRAHSNFTLFLTILGHFGVFCALCYILAKTRSFLGGGACKRVLAVILAPKGLGITYLWLYFDSWQLM